MMKEMVNTLMATYQSKFKDILNLSEVKAVIEGFIKKLTRAKNEVDIYQLINDLKLKFYLFLEEQSASAFKRTYATNLDITRDRIENSTYKKIGFATYLVFTDVFFNEMLSMTLKTRPGAILLEGYAKVAHKVFMKITNPSASFKQINQAVNGCFKASGQQLQVAIDGFIASLTPYFEESSKQLAKQSEIARYYFSAFNFAEFTSYYMNLKNTTKLETSEIIKFRSVAVTFHGFLTILHQLNMPNTALFAHMLWNYLAGAIATLSAHGVQDCIEKKIY